VTDHSDAILCIFFINDRYIATGSKDKTINVYSFDGEKVATLKGHNASICCLSMIRNINGDRFLASGSDHGCSSLFLWDTKTWTIHSKVACHSAAVTAIVDLEDGRHLVTGSYDKKINLFSHAKGKAVSSLNNNKTSVTSMVMTSDRSRLISSGLDNSLSIWTINRKNEVKIMLFRLLSR
jgi:WD40 repeat protein